MAVQLNLASKFDYAISMSTTPGWAAHITIAVTKEPALVQLPKAVTLNAIDVGKKPSEFMLVGELMDIQYTMVMW